MSFAEHGQQTRVSYSTKYLTFLRRTWWEGDVVFSKVIGSTSQNTWVKLPFSPGYVAVTIPRLGVLRNCHASILSTPSSWVSLTELGLKMIAVTSPTLLTNPSPCQPVTWVPPHVSCTLHQTHTLSLYLTLALCTAINKGMSNWNNPGIPGIPVLYTSCDEVTLKACGS